MSMALLPGGAKIAEMLKYALGAGLGSGTARTVAPGNQWVDLAGQLLGGAGIPAAKAGIGALTKPSSVESAVEKGMTKGVRPSVVGKGTAEEAQRYMNKANLAVDTILKNKSNLKFTDETGQIISSQGQLPKNLKEFGEAIDQTRRNIFEQYDAMTKSVPQQPITQGKVVREMGNAPKQPMNTIDLTDIANELDAVASNPSVLRQSPQTAQYAKNKAAAMRKNRFATPLEAQDDIAINNRGLHTMPVAAEANNKWVDKLINDNLRKKLDSLIENTSGPGYQELKTRYGALKEIEQDVVHRSWVDARKPAAGFFDVGNVFTSYEAIRGILSGNVGMITAAAGAKGVTSYMKWLINPNRYVKNMFSGVEKLSQPTSTAISPLGKAALPSSMNLVEGLQGGGW
jgi:hypothetical protein